MGDRCIEPLFWALRHGSRWKKRQYNQCRGPLNSRPRTFHMLVSVLCLIDESPGSCVTSQIWMNGAQLLSQQLGGAVDSHFHCAHRHVRQLRHFIIREPLTVLHEEGLALLLREQRESRR